MIGINRLRLTSANPASLNLIVRRHWVTCDSGQFTRSTLIRRAWLRCGAKRYWLARYCAGKHEAIDTIRNWSAFGRMHCLATQSTHIFGQFIPKQRPAATPSTNARLAHCVRSVDFDHDWTGII